MNKQFENIIEIKDIDLSTFFKNDFLKVKDDKVIDKIEDKNEKDGINDKKEEPNITHKVELDSNYHLNLDIIDEIITSASIDSGISKDIKTDLRIANLQAKSDFDQELLENPKIVYERKSSSRLSSRNNLSFRPFLASREL